MSLRSNYILAVILLALVPSVMGCTTPVFFNEYHVPVPMFGTGLTTINASKHVGESVIDYNFTVLNANNQSMELAIWPSDNLGDFIKENNITIEAGKEITVPLEIDLSGSPIAGKIQAMGTCEDGKSSAVGTINLQIIGSSETERNLDYLYIVVPVILLGALVAILLLKKKKWKK
jgi:hypothetical protein